MATTLSAYDLPNPIGEIDTNYLYTTEYETRISSKDVNIFDNVIILNYDEEGVGVTKVPAVAGLQINRGTTEDPYQIFFNEDNDTLTAGFSSDLNIIPMVPPATASGILAWNYTTNQFEEPNPATSNLTVNNLTVNGTTTFGGIELTWPVDAGTSGYILSTDGNGNLTWVEDTGGNTGGNTDSTTISNSGDTTSITTERIGFPDTIFVTANNDDVLTITQDETLIDNRIKVGSEFNYSPTLITDNSYLLSNDITFINWDGTANGTITLPTVADNSGRLIIIQNISTSFTVSIGPNAGDLIMGKTDNCELKKKHDVIQFISDSIDNWIIK
jgi:hypothetical protein